VFAEKFGGKAPVGKEVININYEVVNRIAKILSGHIKSTGKIAILGMSYKPGIHIIEDSQSILLADWLLKNGYKICAHDPAALEQVKILKNGVFSYFFHQVGQSPTNSWSYYHFIAIYTIFRQASWQQLALCY